MLAQLDDPAEVKVVVVETDRGEDRIEGEGEVVSRLGDAEVVVVKRRTGKQVQRGSALCKQEQATSDLKRVPTAARRA
jgi:hypothetical protein